MNRQVPVNLAVSAAVLVTVAAGLWGVSPNPDRMATHRQDIVVAHRALAELPLSGLRVSTLPGRPATPRPENLLAQLDQLYPAAPRKLSGSQRKEVEARRQAAQQKVVEQLSALGPGGARAIAETFKNTANLRDRMLLAQALARLNDRETVGVLKDLIASQPGLYEQQQLIIALGHRTEPSVVEPLARVLSSTQPDMLKFAAVQALAGRADALPALETVIENGADRTVRLEAIRSIGLMGNGDAKATLIDLAQAAALEPLLRQTAIQELRRSFGAGAQEALASLVNDTEPSVRASATMALAMLQK